MIAAAILLAHQGGWDEVLLILTPIAIFAGLLGLANRRANAEVQHRTDDGPLDGDGTRSPDQAGSTAPEADEAGGTDSDG